MENFGDSEIIIKEWLILLSCFKRHGQRGKNTPQSQFLDKMSKTLAWIVKEIQIYIDEKALGAI
jgi:hypothetical protein